MTTLRQAWARLLSFFRKRGLDREFDEELAAHLELATEEHLRRGMTPAEARRLALVKLGGMEPSKERHRDARGLPWLDGIAQDLRFAVRGLRRNPGFTLTALAMLATGIGINAAVFTVTNAVLFKGFPLVERNDRLLYISSNGCCISYPDFEDIRAQAKSFQGMGITHGISQVLTDENGFAENIDVTEISAGTFQTVGRRPVLGRDFASSDDLPGAASVAILNYSLWESRYARDSAIIGRTIRLNGIPTTVIGVMPRGFSFPQKADLWVPLVKTAKVMSRDSTDTWFAFGRLADGVTFPSAGAEVETIIRRIETAYPVTDRRFHLVVQNFAQFFLGANATAFYGSMWAAVGFVLLIACANLANLLLARAMGRSREISVRIALGGGRWRVIRQLLIESVLLSSLGGFVGWWIAKWGVRTYQLAMARKSAWLILDYTMDHRVLGYMIAISIATGILFGLAPALRLSKLDVNAGLKDGGRSATRSARERRLSDVLVAGELALAIVLLAGAGVMIRSFLKIHSANMGVRPDNVLVGSTELPNDRYPRPEQMSSFYDRLTARLQSMPGMESVAFAETIPTFNARRVPYQLDASNPPDERRRPKLGVVAVSPDYFRTLGATVLAGRDFFGADVVSGVPVAIVNQAFATRFWPRENPLGKRVRLLTDVGPSPWRTVIGVASNIVQNDATRQRFDPLVYVPLRHRTGGGAWLLMRTRMRPEALKTAVRREVRALDPDLPMYGPLTLRDRLEFYWDSRFYGMLFLVFAAIALLMASIGLYTVMAHAVTRRTAEIGIRMAVGATARDVFRLVFRQGMLPLVFGLTIGLPVSMAVNRILKAALIEVSPADPLTLAAASAVLIFSAALGCWIPARRAMRVDPVVALRCE